MPDYLDYYKGKAVLVTGGAGAIGGNLVRALAEIGAAPVIVLDDLSAGHLWNIPDRPGVLFVRGDVCDEVALKRVFQERPRVVFHLAAFFANQNSVDFPEKDLMTNGFGTLRVLEYANLQRGERVVYASSGCSIYSSADPPAREGIPSLTTPYQITKALGELYSNFFLHHHGLKVVNARFFNSYGPGEVPGQYRNVIPNFIFWAMQNRPLPIAGDGAATRVFTYVGDLVDGLLRAGYYEKAVGEEMNLTSGAEVRIADLAGAVNRLTGNPAGIQWVEPRRWDTKTRLLASSQRAREVLGFEPRMAFEEGLKLTIQWFRDHWEEIRRSASFPPGMSSALREMKRDGA